MFLEVAQDILEVFVEARWLGVAKPLRREVLVWDATDPSAVEQQRATDRPRRRRYNHSAQGLERHHRYDTSPKGIARAARARPRVQPERATKEWRDAHAARMRQRRAKAGL